MQQPIQAMNASSAKIGMATQTIPRTSPMVAMIRPWPSASASLLPLPPKPIALMPTARDRRDATTIPVEPGPSAQVSVPASKRFTASSDSCF